MAKPEHVPLPADELRRLALEVIRADRFPTLATIDGDHPRVRPVSPVRSDGFTIYVANLRGYHKTVELAQNPRAELCYVNERHDQVRLSGTAGVLGAADRPLLEEIWSTNPLLRQYLGSLENPALVVYRITPTRVRYMREWALEYYEVPVD